ncbi:MAG: hypothetical protein QM706_07800 [Nitrospira sp.]
MMFGKAFSESGVPGLARQKFPLLLIVMRIGGKKFTDWALL